MFHIPTHKQALKKINSFVNAKKASGRTLVAFLLCIVYGAISALQIIKHFTVGVGERCFYANDLQL